MIIIIVIIVIILLVIIIIIIIIKLDKYLHRRQLEGEMMLL